LISQVITISKEKTIPSLIFHSVPAFENMEINTTLVLISVHDLTGNALEEE